MKKTFTILGLLAFVSVCFVWVCLSNAETDKNEEKEKLSEKNREIVIERIRKIDEEIKTLENHPWAGSYYEGDGLGVNRRLHIAPDNGFAFTWNGCLGLYDQNYGKVKCEDGRIKLSFTFENLEKGFQGLEGEFIPVLWGERHYLIPPEGMVDFCNHVNSGWYRTGRWGQFLLRDGDSEKKYTGMPNIPEKNRPYLLEKPIETTVVELGEVISAECESGECRSRDDEVLVTIGKGEKDGILKGMEFYILENDYPQYARIKITETTETQSKGKIGISEYNPAPKTGWKVSTRSRWAELGDK